MLKELNIILYVILLLVFVFDAYGQETQKNRKDISLYYSFTHIDQNISLNYHQFLGRHALVGGLRMHLQTKVYHQGSSFEGWTFFKQHLCDGVRDFLGSHIGFNLGYRYQLIKSPGTTSYNPYLFYLFQPNLSVQANMTGGVNCKQVRNGSPTLGISPFFVLENIFGVGIQPKLYKRWWLDASAGINFAWFDLRSNNSIIFRDYGEFWERSLAIRVGITYQIGGYEEKSPAFLDKGQFK